ncbi:MAG: PEP-CTERM sorting domain-containing protein [Planctomycetota bacterium]
MAALIAGAAPAAQAAVIYGNSGVDYGSRWDAAPRSVNGVERSLDGGLRFAMQGGSYAAYRDLFSWSFTPSVSAFRQTIEDAFAAWTVIDPVSGLGTDVSFVYDPDTRVQGVSHPDHWVNDRGAEIDLFGVTAGVNWNVGDRSQRGEAYFNTGGFSNDLTLTSGTTGYAGYPISGADIRMNANARVNWNLADFGVILTHEIGHALGFGDVDFNDGRFLDDDFDGSTPESAVATLTNSWAGLVDVNDPSQTPLALYNVNTDGWGVWTDGVDILMESFIPQVFFDRGEASLQNDDFGGRQFLYPWVAPIVSPLFGDFNGSGTVEQGDLNLVLNNWGAARGNWSNADGFGTLAVDQEELNAVLNNWGSSAAPSFAGNPDVVPEPTVGLGFAGIALAMSGTRRRRSKSRTDLT